MKQKLLTCLLLCTSLNQAVAQTADDFGVETYMPGGQSKTDANTFSAYFNQVQGTLTHAPTYCPPTVEHLICRAAQEGGQVGLINLELMRNDAAHSFAQQLNARFSEILGSIVTLSLDVDMMRQAAIKGELTEEDVNSLLQANYVKLSSNLWANHPLWKEFPKTLDFPVFAIRAFEISAQDREAFEQRLVQGDDGLYRFTAPAAQEISAQALLVTAGALTIKTQTDTTADADASIHIDTPFGKQTVFTVKTSDPASSYSGTNTYKQALKASPNLALSAVGVFSKAKKSAAAQQAVVEHLQAGFKKAASPQKSRYQARIQDAQANGPTIVSTLGNIALATIGTTVAEYSLHAALTCTPISEACASVLAHEAVSLGVTLTYGNFIGYAIGEGVYLWFSWDEISQCMKDTYQYAFPAKKST
ncbi:MAG: hypothetical protein J0G29_05385 [Alphaproteobacteria bacterium]|nr:hypothetical protein [Alphaproteobacteria bacterium]OJV47314.1 MAG: hypothetical protein BGO28_01055 [Alphaproteobacteria bacterium 43-37]